jgi:hypothetical protein
MTADVPGGVKTHSFLATAFVENLSLRDAAALEGIVVLLIVIEVVLAFARH